METGEAPHSDRQIDRPDRQTNKEKSRATESRSYKRQIDGQTSGESTKTETGR